MESTLQTLNKDVEACHDDGPTHGLARPTMKGASLPKVKQTIRRQRSISRSPLKVRH